MPLIKTNFLPGFSKEGTQFSTGAKWWDGDKIRFRKGKPEKIGGWVKYAAGSLLGVPRTILDWGTAASLKYLGIGTSLKFYVETGGEYYDVTPLRFTTGIGDVTFAASNGFSTITVTDTTHGALLGDYVSFSDADGLGGLITAEVLNHTEAGWVGYQISNIVDSNKYEFIALDAAGATVTANGDDSLTGGTIAVGYYQLSVGTNTYVGSVGYGAGTYGEMPWNGSVNVNFGGQLRLWSQDAFADDLIINPRGGGVYFWDESDGVTVRAIPLTDLPTASDAPTAALQVLTSPVDRHVICLGVNPLGEASIDPLLIRWSDQEDAGDWSPTAINSAGGQVLSSGTQIIGGVKTRQEILIFTDTSIHSMRYAGAPYVYQFAVIGENVTVVSPGAAVSAGDAVFFMGSEGFYVYQGSVTRLVCDVLDHVFNNINKEQYYKVFAINNPAFSEVTWFYPAETNEVTRYVTFNYTELIWTTGTLSRGAWALAPSRSYPVASTNNSTGVNYLYNHESGYDADGAAMGEYLESGTIPLEDGNSLMFVKRFLPDFRIEGTENNANFNISIKGNIFPQQDLTTKVTKVVTANTKQSHVRVRAREIAVRIEGTGTGYGWTMGDFRFDMRTDGRR